MTTVALTLTKEQEMLGFGMAKIVKKIIKSKKAPDRKDILKLARMVNPEVSDDKAASLTLLGEGASTLVNSGMVQDGQVKDFVEALKGRVGDFSNPADFLEAAIAVAPVDTSVKMLAATLLGD